MNRKTRLALMFMPLAILFAAIALFARDASTPAVERDNDCLVIAKGADVTEKQIEGRNVYRQSSNPANDIAIRCQQLGTLVFNDTQLSQTDIGTGQGAAVIHRKYDFLPDRWQVDVRTGWQDKVQVPAEAD